MNLFKTPFAQSNSGKAFAVLMLLPFFHAAIGILMLLLGLDPGGAFWMAAGEVAVLYALCVAGFRVEVAVAS